ncbi:hypothetical protein ACFCW2_00890 [Qipengyuania sp. DSG2-2]|uniref:hypothetical protein n=1 Tax=Qipengyuania sp. DGS2-2 TaxID=3349631 RepID=UPI0036D2524B
MNTSEYSEEVFVAAMPLDDLNIRSKDKASLWATSSRKVLVFASDPFTWAAIGKAVLNALISAGVSAALHHMFGGKIDQKELLRSFFIDVVDALGLKLEDIWLRQTSAQMRGLKSSFEAYARSPETRGDQLALIAVKADELEASGKEIGAAAMGVTSLASTLRLAAHLEYAKAHNTAGDWQTVSIVQTDFAAHIHEIEKQMPKLMKKRFSKLKVQTWPVVGGSTWGRPNGGRPSNYWFYYKKDGKNVKIGRPVVGGDEKKLAAKYAAQVLKRDRSETLRKMLVNTIVPAKALSEEMSRVISVARGS